MGKMFGIVVVVVGVWLGVEIFNEGSANAFGGILTKIGIADAPQDAATQNSRERIGSNVSRKHADADARRNRLLGE